MTKKVYLLPPKEKLGPFEQDDEGYIRIHGPQVLTIYMAEHLGFTIEEALHEEITVTKEQVMSWINKYSTGSFDDDWKELCRISEKK